jgi:very-short-patch-repair endonuclease
MKTDFLTGCKVRGIPTPDFEWLFAAGRKFAFDWAWPEHKIALEIEGGIYGRGKACPMCGRKAVGAHTSIERLKSDMEKYNLAAVLGWSVLRVRPEQIDSGEAFDLVERILATAGDEE